MLNTLENDIRIYMYKHIEHMNIWMDWEYVYLCYPSTSNPTLYHSCTLSTYGYHFSPRCPLGQKLTGVGTCIDINECAARPCIHGDCVDLVNDFNCNCHDGWEGKVCNSQKLVAAAVLSTGAILAIVICLIILLSKYTSRQRKIVRQHRFYHHLWYGANIFN